MNWWYIAVAFILGVIVGSYAMIWGLVAVKLGKVKKAKALAAPEATE